MHVRAHQGAIGVIVFQERDQGRSHRHHLLGRHIHIGDHVARGQANIAIDPARHQILNDRARSVQLDIRLGDDVLGLFHGRHIGDGFARHAINHLTIRAFNKAILIDHSMCG